MNKKCIFLFFLIEPLVVVCQETKTSERISAIAEELAADENEAGAAELFSDLLYELSVDPVRINSVDEREISRLFFLNDFQVKILIDYVKTSGRIVSPFEIANLPGFDRETAEMLIPFITFEARSGSFRDSVRLRQILLSNFIYKTSSRDSSFAGSPWKNLIKYKFTAGSFSGGFTAEKDAGERFLSGKVPSPDFLSGNITYEGHNIIKHIIIGDYSARFGQGISVNTGMRTGLSLTTPGYLSGRNEIKPYTSSDENNFFRGAAAELSYKNLDLSIFLSRNKIDANLNYTTDSSISTIKSFYRTGLHNTGSTLLKKDVVYEESFGANVSYNLKNLRTGVTLTETSFSLSVLPDVSNPSDRFDFTGSKNSLMSFYYNGLYKSFLFYGEFSSSGWNKFAFVQGVSLRPADRININFLYRSYSQDFVSFHGNGPSGSSVIGNEHGMQGTFAYEAARFLFISAGSDIRYNQWLRYRSSAPSLSKRAEIRVKYLPTRRLTFEALYNYRSSNVDNMNENRIPGLDEIVTRSVRGSMKYSPSDELTIMVRADYKLVDHSGSNGVLLLQDINYKFRNLPFSIWVRWSIYNTTDFESCIYTWENDLLNSFSIPACYGNGSRAYLMASWNIASRCQIRLKYGFTATSVMNSRMKEVHELKAQLRISL